MSYDYEIKESIEIGSVDILRLNKGEIVTKYAVHILPDGKKIRITCNLRRGI